MGQFYKQVKGSATGNPASPIFAEIVLNSLLLYVVEKCSFLIPFLYIYVDDIITCIPRDKVQYMLELLNSYHPDLKFTYELENNCSIPYLDLLIIRKEDKIITDLYQKPTSSGRILNYKSCHAFKHKIAIIKNIKQKSITLSDPCFHQKNFLFFTQYLKNNGYPLTLINSLFYSSQNTSQDQMSHATMISENVGEQSQIRTFKLPFVPTLTKQIVRILTNTNVRIVEYYKKTIRNYFSKVKDTVPGILQTNLVYKLNCGDCEGSYVGQTKQLLKNIIRQHQNDCKKGLTTTGLSDHCKNTGHNFDFENPKILHREDNLEKRLTKEMISIKNTENNVNLITDTMSLNNIYINLIKRCK
ncbi:uncharacterized protein LOC123307145 [Coccinella septempunctata]|uniref:uncharacterized protein LOC123307145 n=1 Tax=Coccinella septempunctata TaxID=41139 RepID=UPI001D0957E7|nr:uncharacterized protein LOC123307145 [Coccinella septempunctata]